MIVIRNASHLIKDSEHTVSNVDILIKDGIIAEIGKNIDAPGAKEIDARRCIVAPGFHNLHTHLYQNFLKGMRDDLPLVGWCNEVTFPFVGVALGDQIDREELFYNFAAIGGLEQLKTGITAFVDLDMSHVAMNRAWQDLGIRGDCAVQSANAWIPPEFVKSDEVMIESLRKYFDEAAPYDLTSTSLGPSTPFCCTPSFLKALVDLGKETGKRVYIHVSETSGEVKESIENCGMTPLEYLDSLGVVNDNMTIVHCVYLTEKEMQLAKERGVTTVHCPMSNMKLADGCAPIKKMLDYGIPVTLGTDGAASNDRLDMFAEMRATCHLARISNDDAAAITAKEAFYMATEGGAKAMGLNSGVLEVGRPADLMLVDTFAVNMTPCHEPIKTLVWCAAPENVRTVIINGEVVLEDGDSTRMDTKALLEKTIELDNACRAIMAGQSL